MKEGTFYIGTSGWHYKHWLGTFYPAGLKSKEQFEYYLTFFDTVEINNSFYRLPSRETFQKWHVEAPSQFMFSVKASRYLTHMKKLREPEDALELLLTRAGELGQKLGTVLFQLPPAWKVNPERLAYFASTLPRGQRFVIEFRNPAW